MFSVCLFTGGPPNWGGGRPGGTPPTGGRPRGYPPNWGRGVPPGVPPNSGGGGAPPGVPPNWGRGCPQGYPPTGGGCPGGTPPNWGGPRGYPPNKKWTKFWTKNGQNFGQKIRQTFWKLLEVGGGGRGRYASCGHAGGLSCFNMFLRIIKLSEVKSPNEDSECSSTDSLKKSDVK